MTLFEITSHRHSAQQKITPRTDISSRPGVSPMVDRITRENKKKTLRKKISHTLLGGLVPAILTLATLLLVVHVATSAMDRNLYPGCTVVDQQDDILVIELEDQLASGSDGACMAAGQLIYAITQDGYRVKVRNSTLKHLGVITESHALELSKGY